MKCILIAIAGFLFYNGDLHAQRLEKMTAREKVSLRGLSVVSDQIVWASGSRGTVARSVDGGLTWTWITVPGQEKRDFRDIEAFDDRTAVIIAVAEPALILKTTDGGANWRVVFSDSSKGMFLDAIYFANERQGVVVGDPIGQKPFLAITEDNGEHWSKPAFALPDMNPGEAFFAASGTNIRTVAGPNGAQYPLFVSGGKSSRLWSLGPGPLRIDSLPVRQGLESTGANSVDLFDGREGIIVGGDFAHDSLISGNCILFHYTNPIVFIKPKTPPHGYRSCAIYLDQQNLLACGITGVDISADGGMNWKQIDTVGYHVCQKAKAGNAVFLAGSNGRIARLR